MNMYGDKERNEDFKFFLEHYNEFYEKYGHVFIVIKNKTVLGTYLTIDEAIIETEKEYELGTFIVQECNGDESGYTNYISSWQLICV